MLHVKLSIDNGHGKKAELEIKEADQIQKIMIIQNVFDLFGIDTDVIEMARVYNQVGQAYKSFFDPIEPIQVESIEVPSEPRNDIREQLIDGYQTDEPQTDDVPTYQAADEQKFTNIKVVDGKAKYRLHYSCPACFNKGGHFIYEKSNDVFCHKCGHSMPVVSSHPDGFPNVDGFGNYFVAGKFRDYNLFPVK